MSNNGSCNSSASTAHNCLPFRARISRRRCSLINGSECHGHACSELPTARPGHPRRNFIVTEPFPHPAQPCDNVSRGSVVRGGTPTLTDKPSALTFPGKPGTTEIRVLGLAAEKQPV